MPAYNAEIKGVELCLETSDGIFSPSSADKGTLAMLSFTEFRENDKVLDLGCGCGIVGILAARLIGSDKVTMCDISEDAVIVSEKNAVRNNVRGIRILKSNGLASVADRDYTLILSNPPYHTDFSVAKGFIENGFGKLAVGGRMIMVTKRLDWYKNKLTAVFGGVRVHEADGYYVFIAEKRAEKTVRKSVPAPALSSKLQRKLNRRNGGKTTSN